jgi:4-amino-4-deoxy-L-arabinose transferase-like glycosyltransferase
MSAGNTVFIWTGLELVKKLVGKTGFHHRVALATFLTLLALRLMIINTPSPSIDPRFCLEPRDGFPSECAFIFDEAHYIPAIRKMLMGVSSNHEHPPLSKLLVAGSILLLGDDPLGWRIIPSILSSAAAAIVPLLAWKLTGRKEVVLLSAMLVSSDVMFFNIGTIAILDGPALFFLLLGTYLLISERYVPAAAVIGLGLLSKTATLFNIAALLLYALMQSYRRSSGLLKALHEWRPVFEKVVAIAGVVFITGVAAYDYGIGAFNNPLDHIDYMLNYHSNLKYDCRIYEMPFRCYVIEPDGRRTAVDLPLSWVTPFAPFEPAGYLVVVASSGDRSWHPIAYWGVYSPMWWTTFVVLAFAAYQVLTTRGGDRLSAFTTSWILVGYGAYFIIAYVLSRWVYTFHFVPTIPALAIGLPVILSGSRANRLVLYALTALQIGWFFTYFPVKSDVHIRILELLNLPR